MTTAYAMACSYARIPLYTLWVFKAYVVYVTNTLTYVVVRCVIRRGQTICLDMFKIFSVYRIYVSHMLTTRTAYAEYASHTPNTLDGRYSYVLRTLLSIYTYG